MRRSAVAFLLLSTVALSACEQTTAPVEKARYDVRPSPELAQRIDAAPSDFTWDLFRKELLVSAEGVENTVQLELRALRVQGGEVMDGSVGGPVPVVPDRLAEGATSGELGHPGTEWSPGPAPSDEWFSTAEYRPESWVSPSEFQAPEDDAVVSAVLERAQIGAEDGVVIVYPRVQGASAGQLEVSPFALILSP